MMIELSRLSLKQDDFGCNHKDAEYYLLIDRCNNNSMFVVSCQEAKTLLKNNENTNKALEIPPLTEVTMGRLEESITTPLYLQQFALELKIYFKKLASTEWKNRLSKNELLTLKLLFSLMNL